MVGDQKVDVVSHLDFKHVPSGVHRIRPHCVPPAPTMDAFVSSAFLGARVRRTMVPVTPNRPVFHVTCAKKKNTPKKPTSKPADDAPFAGLAAGPGAAPKPAPGGTPDSASPFAGMAAGPEGLKAVRALGQKKPRAPPAVSKKTAADFIAEGVVDDVDEVPSFEEADIRFGIDDVVDPFNADAEAEAEQKILSDAEKQRLDVGKNLDVTGDAGVLKRLVAPGVGDVVDAGASVDVQYTGKLNDGSVFDSSRKRPGNFSFELGKGTVIKGWEAGVATMRVGEVAEFDIAPAYAYGRRGMPPVIPGNATLTFEVELVAAKGGQSENIKRVAEYNPGVARTPEDISREYDVLLETQAEKRKGMKFMDRFYFISPFASQTGERAPWYLNPRITFLGVFALCGVAFYLVIIAGGFHVGYVAQPVDVNIFKGLL